MRRRVLICLGLLLALFLAADAIALFSLRRSTDQLSSLAESHRIQTLRAQLLANAVRIESDLLANLTASAHDPEQVFESAERLRTSLAGCSDCHHKAAVQEQLDGLHSGVLAYRASLEGLEIGGASHLNPARWREARAIAGDLIRRTTDMTDPATRHLAVRDSDALASIRHAWLVLSGSFVAALVVAGFIAYYLLRRLTQPVDDLLAGIERIRQGDLSHRFSVQRDREFRDLGNALNQAYDSMKKAQESIFHAEKMALTGKLAAGVAHEVGNPLASISSIAQMMRRPCSLQEHDERVDLLMKEVARISRIVRDLLTFSRPAGNKEFGPVVARELLDHAVNLLKYDQRAANIDIVRDYSQPHGAVSGSADRLIQAFANIMINAFDAITSANGGHGRLTITARQHGDRLTIQFLDDGPGMSAEQIRCAFDPFFTTKQPGEGTGLGLWICSQVIHRHQGTVYIDSTPGQGTALTIELPCHTPTPAHPLPIVGLAPKPDKLIPST